MLGALVEVLVPYDLLDRPDGVLFIPFQQGDGWRGNRALRGLETLTHAMAQHPKGLLGSTHLVWTNEGIRHLLGRSFTITCVLPFLADINDRWVVNSLV